MRRRPKLDTPEAAFLHGGEDKEQIYPQPGQDPAHDAKYQSPYTIGDAAVESVDDPSDQEARESAERRIKEAVPDAERIEQERRRVADEFSRLHRHEDS